MRNNKKTQTGFGLIEIIVATAVISISLFSLTNVVQISFRVAGDTFVKTKAEFLAEEGVEAVRFLRDTSWSSEIDGRDTVIPHYLSFSTTTSMWSLSTTTPELIDGVYTRLIIFDDVYRKDSDDDIIDVNSPESKTLDGGTKKVTSRVSWEGEDERIEFVTYMADIFGN